METSRFTGGEKTERSGCCRVRSAATPDERYGKIAEGNSPTARRTLTTVGTLHAGEVSRGGGGIAEIGKAENDFSAVCGAGREGSGGILPRRVWLQDPG